MLEAGSCTILIDDYDPIIERSTHALRDFIKKYVKVDFIITVKDAVLNDVLAEKGDIHELKDFQLLRLSAIRRKSIRSLFEKLYDGTEKERDTAYKLVKNAIRTSRLPSNHFIYTMLLEIYSHSKNTSLDQIFTEKDIVENFVEVLLNKHRAMADHHKDDPRYNDLILYLGYLALSMMESGNTSISKNEALKRALEFNSICSYDYACERYLSIAVTSGILVEAGNILSFAQTCFGDYAAAKYIRVGDSHEKLILSPDGMVRNDKIVEYYCALSNDPRRIIEAVKERLSAAKEMARQHVASHYGPENADQRIQDLLIGDGLLHMLKDVSRYLPNPEVISCDRDRSDEDLDKEDAVKSAEYIVAEYSVITIYEKLLSLFGRVVKSSPHIREPEYQTGVYRHAVGEYHAFTGVAMLLMERELWPEMKLTIKKYFSEIGVGEIERESFVRRAEGFLGLFMAFVPRLVQKGMALDLGAASHGRIIRTILGMKDITEDETAMLRFLKCDLELDDYIKELAPLVASKRAYVRISLFLKCCELLRSDHTLTEAQKVTLKHYAEKCGHQASVGNAVNYLLLTQERELKNDN